MFIANKSTQHYSTLYVNMNVALRYIAWSHSLNILTVSSIPETFCKIPRDSPHPVPRGLELEVAMALYTNYL